MLKVGDVTWIAKLQDGTEYMLDWIVERKEVEDLVISIKDGRYKEQKFRLARCGIPHLVYLIEVISYLTPARCASNQIIYLTTSRAISIVQGYRFLWLLSRMHCAVQPPRDFRWCILPTPPPQLSFWHPSHAASRMRTPVSPYRRLPQRIE